MSHGTGVLLTGTLLILLPWTTARGASSADDGPAAPSVEPAAAQPPAAEPSAEPAEPVKSKQPEAAREKPRPKKELSTALAALRDRVRRTLAIQRQQPFNTRENNVADLIHVCLAFGCDTAIRDGSSSGPAINGITTLCWNKPCGGYEPLMLCEGHIAARIGYGYQDGPSQLAAMLALSRVPPDYPVRVGENTRTVADLIESEKLSCRAGADLSLKLVALAHYVQDPTWKNGLGEEWSVERLIKEELKRQTAGAQYGASMRLAALTYALELRAMRNRPLEGEFARAKTFVQESQAYSLQAQNSDGSWGSSSTAGGAARDYPAALAATGQVLEWLAMGLSEQRLQEPGVVRAVEYLDGLLAAPRYRGNVQLLSSREIEAVMHAAHALVVYDARVFQPTDPEGPAAEEKTAKAANKATSRK